MSATGPCATILSERAALALVAAGAVDEVVVVEERDDEEGLRAEVPGTEVVETWMGPGPKALLTLEVPCARTLPVTMNKMKKA